MNDVSAITVFCEDIRVEKQNTNTIVGVLPDNIRVDGIPGVMPKIGVYTRLHFDIGFDPGPISIVLQYPSGEEDILTNIDPEILKLAKQDSINRNAPMYGVVSRSLKSPFPVDQEGRITAIVNVGDAKIISGILNFELSDKSAEATDERQGQES